MAERAGSVTFYNLLDEMSELHERKSHDYASDDKPVGNYHFAGQLALLFAHSSQDAGFVGRIGEKLYRLSNLEANRKAPRNESIEDTERDICVITCLWMADRRDRRGHNQSALHVMPSDGAIASTEKSVIEESHEAFRTIMTVWKKLSGDDLTAVVNFFADLKA